MTGHHWFTEVAEAVLIRNCGFFHASALRRGASFRDDLTAALSQRGLVPRFVDCQAVVEGGAWDHVLPGADAVTPGDAIVIWAPERLGARKDFAQLLGQSRPKGQELLSAGARLLIVSSRPKSWFPDPDGSSLISEASKIRPQPVTAKTIRRALPLVDERAAARIAEHALGSVSLAQGFAAIELGPGSSNSKRAAADTLVQDTYREVLSELCVEDLAVLEREVLDIGRFDVDEDDFPASLASQFVDAGIARVDDTTGAISLFGDPCRVRAREALVFVLQRTVAPPHEWRKLAGLLFTYERFVRLTLACHFSAASGRDWKSEALGDLGPKALNVAKGEGFVAGDSVGDLSTPLDWLLLDDLLALAASAAEGGSVGGLSARDWHRQAAVLVPVRNRVAHMRLPRPSDVQEVRTRLTFLQARVRTSGLDVPSADVQDHVV